MANDNENCPYCSNPIGLWGEDYNPLIKHTIEDKAGNEILGLYVMLVGQQLSVSLDVFNTFFDETEKSVKVNYCPMCGKSLEGHDY